MGALMIGKCKGCGTLFTAEDRRYVTCGGELPLVQVQRSDAPVADLSNWVGKKFDPGWYASSANLCLGFVGTAPHPSGETVNWRIG